MHLCSMINLNKKISSISCFVLALQVLFNVSLAQDVMFKKEGDSLLVKVTEISLTDIKYYRFDNLEGSNYSIQINSVDSIVFENGIRQVFGVSRANNSNNVLDVYTKDDELKILNYKIVGREDAQKFYQARNSGAVWTLITTVSFSPLVGIVTALSCATTQPSFYNLNYPNTSEAQNFDYYRAYVEEAHAKKRKKVWKAYGIGSGVWVLLILLL